MRATWSWKWSFRNDASLEMGSVDSFGPSGYFLSEFCRDRTELLAGVKDRIAENRLLEYE